MASSKNNSASADSTGGFKTVAFGFDKNDVTMYIASLRKKMKQMEEEFQDKLKEALENPAASNEALKHEREIIRSEMESMWGNKLNERNQILKQQQNQINELEASVHEKDKIIDALKAELSAANAEGGDSNEMNARAAKAYVQFTTTLRSITTSLEGTLQNVEKTWKGEFTDAINEINAEQAEMQQAAAATAPPQQAAAEVVGQSTAAPAATTAAAAQTTLTAPVAAAESEPVPSATPDEEPSVDAAPQEAAVQTAAHTENEAPKKKTRASKRASKEAQAPAPVPAPAPAPAPEPAPAPAKAPYEPFDFGDEEEDPLKGIIADISDDTPVQMAKPVITEKPEHEKVIEENHDEADEIREEAAESTPDNSLDDFGDLSDLLADPVPKPAVDKKPAKPAVHERPTPPPAPKIEIDDDLSALLADEPSDNYVKPSDVTVGATDDFADLLAEGTKEPDFGDDFLIKEEEPAVVKGDDLDISLVSNMVIVPGEESNGDLHKMLKEQEENEYAQFGDLFVAPAGEDETIDFQKIAVQRADSESDTPASSGHAAKKAEKNEDDLFDFSFLSSDDDEDDMSTDASFPGML